MTRHFVWALIYLLTGGAMTALRAESPLEHTHTNHVIFLPDVTHGTVGGVYTETTVVISNPGPSATEVAFGRFFSPLPITDPSFFPLRAGQTATIKVRGEPFGSGYIQLVATEPIAATAHIQMRPSEDSPILLGEMAVLGQEAISKCTIPVFVNHPIAENTGIIVRPYYATQLLLSLYAADGELLGSQRLNRTGYGPPAPLRLFITELFPDLPAGFQNGCLVVEDLVPKAQAFVAMAAYTRGYALRAGTVSAVDIPVEWIVMLTTPGAVSQQANELAERYHFSVRELPASADDFFLATMPSYTARVVAHDDKVGAIFPNAAGYLSGAVSPKYLTGEW